MTTDLQATASESSGLRVRNEPEREELMADFGRWDNSQASFRHSRGVPVKTSRSWRRRRGLTGNGIRLAGLSDIVSRQILKSGSI